MYFPSWQEITVTLALVAAGFTAFAFIARYFNVFQEESHDEPSIQAEVTPAIEPAPAE
jgi:Ni/Fe-hydrogenase subunit HybB-like protein